MTAWFRRFRFEDVDDVDIFDYVRIIRGFDGLEKLIDGHTLFNQDRNIPYDRRIFRERFEFAFFLKILHKRTKIELGDCHLPSDLETIGNQWIQGSDEAKNIPFRILYFGPTSCSAHADDR